MRYRVLGLAALLLGVTALSVFPSNVRGDDAKKEVPATPAALPEAKAGNSDIDDLNEVSLRLWAASQDQVGDGNVAWLPTVTSRSLLVLGRSSSGSAKKEFDSAFPLLAKKREKEYGTLLKSAGNDKMVLKTTSAFWAKAGVKFRPTLMKEFDADFGVKSFITPADAPAEKINRWIESVTDGKVKGCVSPEVFKADPPFVITTAASIVGTWEKPFKAKTYEDDFVLADGKTTVKPQFMRLQTELVSFEVNDGLAVALPVEGGATALYILPKDGKSLDDVVKGLSATSIRDAADKATSGTKKLTFVAVPQHSCESTIDLKKTATALGIKKAFDGTASPADLSFEELTPSDVFIASWHQKTTHKWTDKGFEGTAVEVVVGGARGIDPAPAVTFKANKPFLFAVIDKGLIVDLARVNNPTK